MKLATLCVLLLVQGSLAEVPTCRTVEWDQIMARDFAAAIPAFSTLPPETPIAPSPAPGARRGFKSLEIQQIARKYALTVPAGTDLCFEWQMAQLDRERVIESMRQALKVPNAKIEVVEMSLYPTPKGELSFDAERIGTPAKLDPPSPVLWRGDIIFGNHQRFAIWARVIISAKLPRVMTVSPVRAGEEVAASKLKAEINEGFPRRGSALTLDEAVGQIAVRSFPAGVELRRTDLSSPREVNPGDAVDVEVRYGSTRLALIGTAVTAGRIGEIVSVRNSETKKLFQAHVTGKGTVLVQLDGKQSN